MTFTKNPLEKLCLNCGTSFRPVTFIHEKRVPLYKRKYCFTCVPYTATGANRFISKTRNTLDGNRQCLLCLEFKDLNEFSFTNKRGNLNSYCKRCSAAKKKAPSQRFKQECISYKGGKCIRCGYERCPAALEFHHRNPTKKDFAISKCGTTTLTSKIREELDKCDLVCSNCHKEIHYST